MAPRPPLGKINVIFATPSHDADSLLGIMSVSLTPELEEQVQEFKRVRHGASPILGFSEEDTIGTFHPMMMPWL